MVCRNQTSDLYELPEEPNLSDTATNCFKNRAKNIADSDEINDKIQKILKLLTLRDQNYLIQIWSPYRVGKCKLLKTADQPFRIGIHNQGLCTYRSESEHNMFRVDEEHKEEDLIPIICVFRQQLPEWTADVTNYHSKKHLLQHCVTAGNLHGYLVLPVFESITMLCVGVLELVSSSKYLDCGYEIQEIHQTLKVEYKNRQHELDEIFKDVCDTHKLPIAQTWIVSSQSSFVATKDDIEMKCNSFNAICIGKVCMSTIGLPFYFRDLCFWNFREACREHHLLKSEGGVGRALSSHGSCLCPDVTKLGEDEYSLVHNALMSGLTSCFAVYLDSSEHDDGYILEFFFPVNMKANSDLHNFVRMMKMHFKFSSIVFGDLLSTNVIGIPTKTSQLSLTTQPTDTNQKSSLKETMHLDSKDPHTVGEIDATTRGKETMFVNDVITSKNIDATTIGKEFKSREQLTYMKQKRKHGTNSLTSIGEASMNHGSLSREIVHQDSRETQAAHETNAQHQQDFSYIYPKNRNNAIINTKEMHVNDARSKKLDVVIGEKGASTKQRRKRKMDYITQDTIQQYFGKPIGEASMRLGVSRSTLKRVCHELKIASWPTSHRSKKYAQFSISAIVLLLVRVKRWFCSSNHHGFSAMWWICDKHNAFVCESNPLDNITLKGETICGRLYYSQLTKESDESIETAPFYNTSQAHFGASPKKERVLNVSDTRMITVKATFKDDIIKFQFPLSSGVSELKSQVAQRINSESTRLRLKYKDEDDDLILISCDADIRNLMPFSAATSSKNTIKLIVQMAND